MARVYRRTPPGLAAFVDRALVANPATSAVASWREWTAAHGEGVAEYIVRRLVARWRRARAAEEAARWAEFAACVRVEAILDARMRRAGIAYRPESVAEILARLRPPGLGQSSGRAGRRCPGIGQPASFKASFAAHNGSYVPSCDRIASGWPGIMLAYTERPPETPTALIPRAGGRGRRYRR